MYELGFYEDFITPMREKYLNPICRKLFAEETGERLDSHKAFVVAYRIGEDEDLATHYDNAEVTLNVILNPTFYRTSPHCDLSCQPLITSGFAD